MKHVNQMAESPQPRLPVALYPEDIADLGRTINTQFLITDMLHTVEVAYHLSIGMDHMNYCDECNLPADDPHQLPLLTRRIADLLFTVHGCLFVGPFRSRRGHRQTATWNMPAQREWIGKECEYCNGEMEVWEIIVRSPTCGHIFHRGCYHDYLRTQIPSRRELDCLVCHKSLFLAQ